MKTATATTGHPGAIAVGTGRGNAKLYVNPATQEIIGIKDATLLHATEAGPVLTQTTLDTATYADGAVILLTNSTGNTVSVVGIAIRGKLVARLSGNQGFVHDAFADYDRIAAEGERLFEIGNNYICTIAQVRKLADWWWKYLKESRNRYTVLLAGCWYWLTPGGTYTLQIGGVGEREYIDAVCILEHVEISRNATDIGFTTAEFRVAYRNWTFDSNALARTVASGVPWLLKSGTGSVRVVSATDTGAGDYYCKGTDDQTEIQAAIDYLAGAHGGGIVHLGKGQFNVTAAIELADNIILEGEGINTIIEKNCNDYAIECIGVAETRKSGAELRNLRVTRNAADTNSIHLLYFAYTDDAKILHCEFEGGISGCVAVGYSERVTIFENVFKQTGVTDGRQCIYCNISSGLILANKMYGGGVSYPYSAFAIVATACPTLAIAQNHFEGFHALGTGALAIYCSGLADRIIQNNTLRDFYAGGAATDNDDAAMFLAGSNTEIGANNIRDAGPIAVNTSAVNVKVSNNYGLNNGNLMLRGSCESTTPPFIKITETDDSQVNCTFAMDSGQAYDGSYSYLFTKTNAAGTAAQSYFHNALSTSDLVSLVPGCTYTLRARIYIPSGGIQGSEVKLQIGDYVAAWAYTEQAAADVYDEWQEVEVTRTILAAGGACVLVEAASTAAINETFYVDKIRLIPVGVHNEHDNNFLDLGTGTLIAANSWQNPFPG